MTFSDATKNVPIMPRPSNAGEDLVTVFCCLVREYKVFGSSKPKWTSRQTPSLRFNNEIKAPDDRTRVEDSSYNLLKCYKNYIIYT